MLKGLIAVLHLRRLLELNPYSETILDSLLTALAAMEDRSGIKKEFGRFTQQLWEDLGVKPSARLTALYHRLTSG